KSRPHLSASGRTRRGGADDERLNYAVLPNRIDQFLQRLASKILPRLQRARDNTCQANLVHSLARLGHVRNRGDRRGPNQRTKTFTETRTCHAPEATGTASSTQTATRTEQPSFAVLPGAKQAQPPSGDRLLAASTPPPPQKKVKKSLKKVIDIQSPNLVSTRHGSKTDTGLLPGRFFVCSDPSNQKNKTNTTG